MKEIFITITDGEGEVLFETSPSQIRRELEKEFPEEDFQIRARDLLDAVESELELPFYNS